MQATLYWLARSPASAAKLHAELDAQPAGERTALCTLVLALSSSHAARRLTGPRSDVCIACCHEQNQALACRPRRTPASVCSMLTDTTPCAGNVTPADLESLPYLDACIKVPSSHDLLLLNLTAPWVLINA